MLIIMLKFSLQQIYNALTLGFDAKFLEVINENPSYYKIMNKTDALNKISQTIRDILRRSRVDQKKQVTKNRPANEKSIKQAEAMEKLDLDKDLVIQSLLHLKSDPILKGGGQIGYAFKNREIGYVDQYLL